MVSINKTKITATAALLAALALLLGYVEHLVPIVPPLAGIKLGLANIAVLLALRITDSPKLAFGITMTKVMLGTLLFAGMGTLPYSLSGAVASFVVMARLNRHKTFSAVGISAAGGTVHMAAQVMVAVLMTATAEVAMLLSLLCTVGVLTGIGNGLMVNVIECHIGVHLQRYLAGNTY